MKPRDRVLEIGCGRWHIATGIGERAEVLATDINAYDVGKTLTLGKVGVRGDLLKGIWGSFDMVIFNPPLTSPPSRGRG
ncbi:MAG: hypothetical protein MUC66_04975 [Methanolinea sp.]|nr:hypothetical protein [Methanolinea sp.]